MRCMLFVSQAIDGATTYLDAQAISCAFSSGIWCVWCMTGCSPSSIARRLDSSCPPSGQRLSSSCDLSHVLSPHTAAARPLVSHGVAFSTMVYLHGVLGPPFYLRLQDMVRSKVLKSSIRTAGVPSKYCVRQRGLVIHHDASHSVPSRPLFSIASSCA